MKSLTKRRKLLYVAVNNDDRTDYMFLREIEQAMARAGFARRYNQPFPAYVKFARLVGRVGLVRNVLKTRRVYVVPSMQVSEHRFFPVAYVHETIPYFMDCWERWYPRFVRCLKAVRARVAFFSARQSAEYLQTQLPHVQCHWLPEACNPATYDPGAQLADRKIDVLEMGRRHGQLHDTITPALSQAGRVHLYQKGPQLVFPALSDFIAGLGQSRISICFPGSMTNKEWAGNIETVTYRYFETIASRCVLFGHCPAELKDLFGYDPVVAADLDRPFEQIEHILNHLPEYQRLVDRNYQRLLEVGTWEVRIRQMLEVLEPMGYVPAMRI